MHKLLITLFFAVSTPTWAQTKITWKTLADVSFTDKYSEAEQAYYYYPHFGTSVKVLEGKEVYIKGYMLVIDPDEGIFILSKSPYAECFFCGNGGPESIVELKLKPGHPKFRMDQLVTMKGKLKLNRDDLDLCNYILVGAEIYQE
ncbi:DUF3299 domain-containing protein [Reichenbachiella agarivorans]|uniref:DUF3299 domain-containing protein n=1 Tax=Reichenbachiella agarivorans TaxID=2979464 RepID=A0ABY6CJU7_9BACT|nr:DUF3299 domain-containing protein [Reichenbachiella agarivorans]UXP30783.1 DUF3299 domain-containing protein [Reichenbachiella agarivorans]